MVGKRIGQYRVMDRLGNGGMGAVYRAIDELLDRPVALKVLEADIDESSNRFRAEAAALARLHHPGIATLFELIEDNGRLVMVMELVKGQTLHQIVEQVGVLSAERAAQLCMQALEALGHAHAAGVVHRDLKPANLMLTTNGAVKILDFGIARLDGAVHLTRVGSMMGTPAYMAPEQVLGTAIDARADLYAMGVVFYRLITAELPFRGDTPFEMAQAQVNDEPTPVNLVRPEVPSWAAEIIARALAKAPEHRFQSAMEFHEALARGLNLNGVERAQASRAREEVTEVMPRPTAPGPNAAPVSVVEAKAGGNTWITWAGAAAGLGLVGVISWVLIAGPVTSTAAQAEFSAGPQTAGAPPTGETTPVSTPVVSLTPVPQPAPAPGVAPRTLAKPEPASAAEPPATFRNVKWLEVNGTSTSAKDATLTLSSTELSATPDAGAGTGPLATLAYRQVAKATYVHAKDPVWDPALAAPGGRIDVPGILGRSRHWLVIQTPQTYAILRLDGDDRLELLKTFEGRAGLTIVRPSKDK